MLATRRRIVAAFCGPASLRSALDELSALGVGPAGMVQAVGAEALQRLARPAARPSQAARRLERALLGGATLLLIPVDDDDAGKRISLALLRHSDGPVEVQDDFGRP